VRGFLLADFAVNQNLTRGSKSFRCAGETSNSSQNVRKDGGGGCMSGHVKVEGGVRYIDESVKVERGYKMSCHLNFDYPNRMKVDLSRNRPSMDKNK
jgi:hypothetical protein